MDTVLLLVRAGCVSSIKRDPGAQFRFLAVQTEQGRALAAKLGIDPDNPRTNAVVVAGRAYFKSEAALQVLGRLPGWSGQVGWRSFLARCATGSMTASPGTGIGCSAAAKAV